MAVETSIIGYGSKHNHEFRLYLSESSYDIAQNISSVYYEFSVYKSSQTSWEANNITYQFSVNGNGFSGTIPAYTTGARLVLATGYLNVQHNADGSKVIGAYFNVYDGSGSYYGPGNASGSGNLTLTTIPRSITVSSTVASKTYNSVTINWTTSGARSNTRYRLNQTDPWIDAGGTVASNNQSGTFTITGLNSNTQYTIEVACLGTLAQLWYYDPNAKVVTTDPANITITASDIDYGENLVLTLTNPSNLATTLTGTVNNTEIINQSIVTGENTIVFTDEQLTNIFKEYGDISQSNTVTMVLIAEATNGSTDTVNLVITFTGDRATIWVKSNNTWKKGIVWIKDNNTWKKGIVWKGVNGQWKKAL